MAAIVAQTARRAYGHQVLEDKELGQYWKDVERSSLYTRDSAEDAKLNAPLRQLDAPVALEEDDEMRDDVPLCTATQLTFTLPPAADGLSYFVRYRVLVDAVEKQEWTNPLQYHGGAFFSPKLKGYKASTQLPPPVILGKEWEELHIERMWRWQSQCIHPDKHKGEARLFTLSGLVPSVTGSRGASWIGGGLYGERTVELQYKLQAHGAKWTDTDGWKIAGTYKTPATDVTTMLFSLALNWLKAEGVPKLQETLVSEIGTKHRQSNIRALRHFVAEAKEKLEPFYLAQVVPFLEHSKVLQFVLPEKQDEWLRRVVLSMMQTLQQHKLIAEIPQKFERDAPTIKLLLLSVAGKPLQELAMDKLAVEWVEVPEGESFTIQVIANRSAVGQQKPRAKTMTETQTQDFGMRIWFLAQQSGDSGISFRKMVQDGDDPEQFVVFGQKLRRRELTVNDAVEGTVSCELPIRGRHAQHDYALLERGTELSISVICEEHWAYENDHVSLRIRIVPPHVQHAELLMDASAVGLPTVLERMNSPESVDGSCTVEEVRARHIPRRLTAPKVFGNARVEEEVRSTYRKSARFLNLQSSDLNVPSHSAGLVLQLNVPREVAAEDNPHGAQPVELNRRRLVHMILTELGHFPADDDIEYCLMRLQERGGSMDEDTFFEYYSESNWAKPMLAEALQQLEATVRKKRNEFLLNSVQLPLDQWGFEPTEWGFPATALWKEHAANLAKEQIHELWVKQIARLRSAGADVAGAEAAEGDGTDEHSIQAFAGETGDDSAQDRHVGPATPAAIASAAGTAKPAEISVPSATSVADRSVPSTTVAEDRVDTAGTATAATVESSPSVNLRDKDAVRAAPLLQVVENLSVAMAKHYLSELLPTSTTCAVDVVVDDAVVAATHSAAFDGERRAEWVEEMVASASMGKACEQLAFFKLAAQHRKWVAEAQHREASKAAALERTLKVQSWLAKQSRADASLNVLPPDGVSVSDVAIEIVKEKVKMELQQVILEQLEDMRSEATAHARSYWEQHWGSIGCAVVSCVVLPMAGFGAVVVKVMRM